MPPQSAVDLQVLREKASGPVLVPGDPDFDDTLTGFQTSRRHQPDVLVDARTAEDIVLAIAFANANGLPVGVQGTGHALAAVAGSGGVLITTRKLTEVSVDAGKRKARVYAGTPWGDVITAAAAVGLAPLSGPAADVSAVSYTLGGGLGPLSRRFGFAADHVKAVHLVTADGRQITTSPEEEPDLFWAVRGGRDNFGIAVWIEIDLFPITQLFSCELMFPAEDLAAVLRGYRAWAADAPDEATSSLTLFSFPDLEMISELLRGRRVARVHAYVVAETGADGSLAEYGARLLEPLRHISTPIVASLHPLAFTDMYREPIAFPGAVESSTVLLHDMDERTIEVFAGVAASGIPRVLELRPMGGEVARTPQHPNAISHRDAGWLAVIASPLDDDLQLEQAQSAATEVIAELGSNIHGGRLLNFMSGHSDGALVRDAYDDATWERLTRIKREWDPSNVFRLNHNIPPA